MLETASLVYCLCTRRSAVSAQHPFFLSENKCRGTLRQKATAQAGSPRGRNLVVDCPVRQEALRAPCACRRNNLQPPLP